MGFNNAALATGAATAGALVSAVAGASVVGPLAVGAGLVTYAGLGIRDKLNSERRLGNAVNDDKYFKEPISKLAVMPIVAGVAGSIAGTMAGSYAGLGFGGLYGLKVANALNANNFFGDQATMRGKMQRWIATTGIVASTGLAGSVAGTVLGGVGTGVASYAAMTHYGSMNSKLNAASVIAGDVTAPNAMGSVLSQFDGQPGCPANAAERESMLKNLSTILHLIKTETPEEKRTEWLNMLRGACYVHFSDPKDDSIPDNPIELFKIASLSRNKLLKDKKYTGNVISLSRMIAEMNRLSKDSSLPRMLTSTEYSTYNIGQPKDWTNNAKIRNAVWENSTVKESIQQRYFTLPFLQYIYQNHNIDEKCNNNLQKLLNARATPIRPSESNLELLNLINPGLRKKNLNENILELLIEFEAKTGSAMTNDQRASLMGKSAESFTPSHKAVLVSAVMSSPVAMSRLQTNSSAFFGLIVRSQDMTIDKIDSIDPRTLFSLLTTAEQTAFTTANPPVMPTVTDAELITFFHNKGDLLSQKLVTLGDPRFTQRTLDSFVNIIGTTDADVVAAYSGKGRQLYNALEPATQNNFWSAITPDEIALQTEILPLPLSTTIPILQTARSVGAPTIASLVNRRIQHDFPGVVRQSIQSSIPPPVARDPVTSIYTLCSEGSKRADKITVSNTEAERSGNIPKKSWKQKAAEAIPFGAGAFGLYQSVPDEVRAAVWKKVREAFKKRSV